MLKRLLSGEGFERLIDYVNATARSLEKMERIGKGAAHERQRSTGMKRMGRDARNLK